MEGRRLAARDTLADSGVEVRGYARIAIRAATVLAGGSGVALSLSVTTCGHDLSRRADHFAYSTARVSRITVTLIWPG